MSKLTAALPLILVIARGPSNEEVQNTATKTCDIMTESRTIDAVITVKDINAAREKINEDSFLGRDTDILLPFKRDLCERRVSNDDDYESLLAEQQNQEALGLSEPEPRIALENKIREQAKIDREKSKAIVRRQSDESHKHLKLSMLAKNQPLANEKTILEREKKGLPLMIK